MILMLATNKISRLAQSWKPNLCQNCVVSIQYLATILVCSIFGLEFPSNIAASFARVFKTVIEFTTYSILPQYCKTKVYSLLFWITTFNKSCQTWIQESWKSILEKNLAANIKLKRKTTLARNCFTRQFCIWTVNF